MKRILCILAVLVLVCALSAAASAEPTKCYNCENTNNWTPCTAPEDHIEATCSSEGRDCYICSSCGTHNYVMLGKDSNKHTWVKGNTYQPTCINQGYTEYTCSCGETKQDDFIPATGHNFISTGQIVEQPTYTKMGTVRYECTNPGCTITEDRLEIPMLKAISDIALSRSSVELKVGGTYTISASVGPSDATKKDLNWSSSTESVATVSNGVITARGVGIAYIQAIAADGQGAHSNWCTVTVYQSDEPTPTPTTAPTPTQPPTPTTPPATFCTVQAYTNPAGFAIILGSGTYPTGSDVTLTIANIIPGYIFTGWSLSNGLTSLSPNFTFTINSNITAVANFARSSATYCITYMPNDADETEIYTQEKFAGISVKLRSALYTKEGYIQSGWKTPYGRIYNFGSKYIIDSNLVLYPVWSRPGRHTLTVTFNEDGKGKVHTGNTTVENGMTFTVYDNDSATFHFDTMGDIYPYNIMLNGVSKGSYSTYTVRGQAHDQELHIEFGSIYDHPKTGDSNDVIIYSVLAVTSLAGLTGMILSRRKKNDRV